MPTLSPSSTPLLDAVRDTSLSLEQFAQHLVDANLLEQDALGRNALTLLAQRGPAERLPLLTQVFDPNAPDANGITPLMHAATWNNLLMVKALLPLSNARATTSNGSTALMFAACEGAIDAVNALLPHSEVDARTHQDAGGQNALEMALEQNNVGAAHLIAARMPVDHVRQALSAVPGAWELPDMFPLIQNLVLQRESQEQRAVLQDTLKGLNEPSRPRPRL